MDAAKLNRTLFIRDNLEVLRGIQDKSIDLIYLDPPFNSNKNYGVPIGGKQAGFHFKDMWTPQDNKKEWYGELSDKHQGLYEIIHAVGCINGNKHKAYLIYMAIRLIEMYKALKDTGSIYLHCDHTMVHSLKLIMDVIFNKKNFQNEIVWQRIKGTKGNQYKKSKFPNLLETLLYYKKGKDHIFNYDKVHTHIDEEDYKKKKTNYPHKDEKGDYERRSPFRDFNQGSRPNLCYEYKGFKNPSIAGWKTKKEKLMELDQKGFIEIVNNKIYRKNYLKTKGNPISNLWTDIEKPNKLEDTNYETQKPLLLLERIINISSNKGDVVLDPFCGCTTACIAAEKLGRKWIGIDISERASVLLHERLKKEIDKSIIRKIAIRNDIPIKNAPKPSKDIKHILYGQQEGNCKKCKVHFPIKNLTIDHIIPKSKGGQDTDSNFQLLCNYCNSVKGNRLEKTMPIEEDRRLKKRIQKAREITPKGKKRKALKSINKK